MKPAWLSLLALLGCGFEERDQAFTRDASVLAVEPLRDAGKQDPAGDAGVSPRPRDGGTAAASNRSAPQPAATGCIADPVPELADAGLVSDMDCPPPDGVEDSSSAVHIPLTLEVPSEPPIAAPFALAVSTSAAEPLSAPVRVCANGKTLASLQLYRGRGSVSLRVPEAGRLLLQARAAHASGARSVVVAARPTRPMPLDPDLQQHTWTADQDVVIEGELRLPTKHSLTIAAGTRILLGANARLTIAGELRVQGTHENPVLLTRAGESAWGGLALQPGARAWIDHTWFVAGGGDSSRPYGHSNSQPVVWVNSAALKMRGGGLIDNPGKAFASSKANIKLDETLISRCDTGGQFDTSQLEFRHLHVLEIPDADGQLDDDDNDGFYFDDLSEDAGVEVAVEDSVFARGEDDAIDQNGAKLRVERVWIEDFQHEGVACSNKRAVTIRDSVVRSCAQGVEAGYGAPRVRVERSLITDNGVGVRFGDEYGTLSSGSLDVSHSIVAGNQQDALNLDAQQGGYVPDALHISCSVVDDTQLAGGSGNVLPPAPQPWPTNHCSDDPLLDTQQCQSASAGPPCP